MKRDATVDIAKGIAICLMVIGHCYCKENFVLKMIYSFHMPFFFMISGVLYATKWSGENQVKISLGNSCMRLLIPYVTFELLFVVFLALLQRPENFLSQILEKFFKIILPMRGVTVTWFLPCQLLISLFSALIIKCTKKSCKWIGYISFTILFLIGLIAPISNGYLTVFWRVFVGMGFFSVGFYGATIIRKQAKLWLLLLFFAFFIVASYFNEMPTLVALRFGNRALYVISGILGSYLLIQVCLRARMNSITKSFAYLGKNSVIILCTHMFVVEIIRLLDSKLFNNLLPKLGIFEGVVFGAIIIAIMYGFIPICNYLFWYLFGNTRRNR